MQPAESRATQREMGHASSVAWHVSQILEHGLLWRYIVVDHCSKRGRVCHKFATHIRPTIPSQRKEDLSEDETSVTSVYKSIWSVSKLKSSFSQSATPRFMLTAECIVTGVRSFLLIHLTSKISFAAHDAATSLKMVEKGLRKEDFAMAALLDFPIQVIGGYFVSRWSRGDRPLRPWIWALLFRVLFTCLAAVILWGFPPPPITAGFFAFIILFRSLGEMATSVRCQEARAIESDSVHSTTQFVCMGAFHARVSDPLIGGTYITVCIFDVLCAGSGLNGI
jgi:MFS transporter, PAT family, solute carrier family 33 (acetyl-CoA transportor), member 1